MAPNVCGGEATANGFQGNAVANTGDEGSDSPRGDLGPARRVNWGVLHLCWGNGGVLGDLLLRTLLRELPGRKAPPEAPPYILDPSRPPRRPPPDPPSVPNPVADSGDDPDEYTDNAGESTRPSNGSLSGRIIIFCRGSDDCSMMPCISSGSQTLSAQPRTSSFARRGDRRASAWTASGSSLAHPRTSTASRFNDAPRRRGDVAPSVSSSLSRAGGVISIATWPLLSTSLVSVSTTVACFTSRADQT